MFYVINAGNSINNTTNNPMQGVLMLGVGDHLLVQDTGSILGTGSSSDALYVNGYAESSQIIVNGLLYGTRNGIYSLGNFASFTINGQVIGGSTGLSASNSASVYVSSTGLISGREGVYLGGSTLKNDGTVTGTGSSAVQISSGTIYNTGLISGRYEAIFFSADGDAMIHNNGQIQGGLSVWYGALPGSGKLSIVNTGSWVGSLGLTPSDDMLTNTGTIHGDVSLGNGADYLDSSDGLITGRINGGGGADTIMAGTGDDVIEGGAGADYIDGGAGNNTASYGSSATGVRVNLMTGAASHGDAAGDRLFNIQNIYGTLARDVLVGDNQNNILDGVVGGDTLRGNGGNDILRSYGTGKLIAEGGGGNDRIELTTVSAALYGYAFTADCRIDGGAGYDTLELTNSGTVVFQPTTVTAVEKIVVREGFNYNLTSDNATVAAGATLEVDATALVANNRIIFDGTAELDGKFIFNGGAGKDIFRGGRGADVLNGGAEADVLTGGAGADVFEYESPGDSFFSARDRITDFNANQDKFKLDVAVAGFAGVVSGAVSSAADLAALLANVLTANQAIIVDVTGGSLAGRDLLVIDGNGNNNYQLARDYVIDITGYTGVFGADDFIV